MGGLHGDCIQSYLYIYISLYISIYLQGGGSVATVLYSERASRSGILTGSEASHSPTLWSSHPQVPVMVGHQLFAVFYPGILMGSPNFRNGNEFTDLCEWN